MGTAMKHLAGTALALVMASGAAMAKDKVTVAYFLEWPTANQLAQIEKIYDEEMGVALDWRAFGNGNEMTQAMISGNVDIAYSQGFVPFVVGVSSGAPIKMVGVAVTYAENDNCIVRADSGITAANATELEGKRVATPIGNVTHYKLLRTMDHLGVDAGKLDLVQMNPPDGAVALARGDVVMACGFGGALKRMREYGDPLMTGAEQEAIGINTFDIISATDGFIEDNPELLRKFIEITEATNEGYRTDPEPFYPIVANAAGMSVEDTKSTMEAFGFPSADDQISANWMGGGVQQMTKGVADVMVEAGGLDNALDDYSEFIDMSFLQ